jgi:hypothetical protein
MDELMSDESVWKPPPDGRPRMPEPPPVRLLTVQDAMLIAAAGLERDIDAFYVDLLKFERLEDDGPPTYRAANFLLRFEIVEPPLYRDDLRALGIEVDGLREIERVLIEREIPHVVQKGITPGIRTLLLRDPAGNWIELSDARQVNI